MAGSVKPQAASRPLETWHSLRREMFAELLGCAFMTVIACGVVMSAAQYNQPGTAQISSAFGFGMTYTVLFFALGHISGAHLNSAITVGLASTQVITWRRCLLYLLAQVIGSCLGIIMLWAVEPRGVTWERACFGATYIPVNADINAWQGLLVEVFLGFVLLLVFNSAMDSKYNSQASMPLCVGFAIFVGTLFGHPLTGAGLNPTMVFAAALAASSSSYCSTLVWKEHWIFWVGPILGGVAASLVYEHVLKHPVDAAPSSRGQMSADYRERRDASLGVSPYGNGETAALQQDDHIQSLDRAMEKIR